VAVPDVVHPTLDRTAASHLLRSVQYHKLIGRDTHPTRRLTWSLRRYLDRIVQCALSISWLGAARSTRGLTLICTMLRSSLIIIDVVAAVVDEDWLVAGEYIVRVGVLRWSGPRCLSYSAARCGFAFRQLHDIEVRRR
jgi:hypothetical protein